FRTDCDLINTLPFEESFDTYGTGSGTFLTCWGKITSNTYPYISTTNSSSPGSMYMYTASGAYNYIVTPEFDVSIPINSLSAFFKLYKTGAAYNITVGVMSDPTDATTFDSITNLSPTSTSTWQIFGVDFTNYTGIGQHIAFKVQGYGATNSMYIDDLMINTTPSCSIPTGLTDYDSLATPNSITLDWDGTDDANVLSWIVEYKPIDETTWQSEDAFAHPFVLTGLQSSIVYQVRLYAICSSGDTTYATNTINVGMPCEAITTIPWNEGFEGVWFVAYGLNTGTHPWCWTNINGGTQASGVWRKTTTSSYVHSGTGALQMYSGSTSAGLSGDWMISPPISLTGNERLRFWAKGYSTYTDILSVKIFDVTTNGVVDAEADTSLFIDIMPNTIIPASDWTEYEVNLNQYFGDYQIAFVRNTTGGYYLNIDDISITEIPACARPTDVTVNYVTNSEMQISWIPGNVGDASWYLYYKTLAATDYDSVLVTSNTSYTLQTLDTNTTYNIYLKTICATELSEATNIISVTTSPCQSITTIPWSESFDTYSTGTGTFPTCWIKASTNTSYPYISTTNNSAPGSMYFYASSGYNLALTPSIDPTIAINTLRANFKLRKTSASYNISVGVMSNPNDISTFNEIVNLSPSATSVWEDFEVSFAPYQGQGTYIGFKVTYSGSSNYMYLDDLVVSEIPGCAKPTQILASNINLNDAEISWTPGNSTDVAWWLYYKPTMATIYDSIYVTTNPYTMLNLLENTSYDIYLVTDCGDQLSEPSDVYSFRTPCVPITSLPLTESFDYYGTSAGTFPPCWARPVLNTTTPYPSIVTAYSTSSPASLRFQSASATAPTYAITPQIDFDINTLKVKFMLKAESTTSSGTMEVGVMSDNTNLSTFEVVDTITPTSTAFTEYEVSFENTTINGIGNHIAFRHITNSSVYYYWLDDVVVDVNSICDAPDSLQVSMITQTTADISFSPSDLTDTQWKLFYRAIGDLTWIDYDLTTTNYQLTGLTANTVYELFVRTLCSDATYSDAGSIITFRTACEGITTMPYTENFDTYGTGTAATSYPTCWSRNVTTYSTANYPYISTTNYSSPGAMYFYAYNNTRTVAVSNPIDASIPLNTLTVEFKMRYSTLDNNGIQVGVMSDPNDFTTFVPVGTPQTISETNVWEDKVVMLTDYSGSGQFIALAAIAPASEYARAYVDNFVVDYTPNCPDVYGLAVGAASTTSVNVNWDNSGDEGDGFNIAYASNLAAPFDPTTATIIPIPTGTTLPYILPGFNPGDSVWVAVQRGCLGNWTDAQKVILPTSSNLLPFSFDFEDSTIYNTWTINNGTQTNKWFIGPLGANGTGNGLYISSDNGVTAGYTNTTSVVMVSTLIEFDNSPEFALSFDWKAGGEGTTTLYDYIAVYVLPVGEPVVAGTLPSETYRVSPKLNLQSTWQTENISLGSEYSNSIQQVVFAWRNDGSGGIQPGGMIDNINVVGLTCPSTTDLVASNITTTSADISWSSNLSSVTDWWIYWKEATATDWVDSLNISQNPYTLSNLLPNTPYQVRIINNCGTELSLPMNILNFRTACDIISTLPYIENFDTYGGTGSAYFPSCWEKITTYSTYPYLQTTNHSAPASLYFYASSGTYNIAVLPEIDASIPINTLMATFWMRTGNTTSNLIVGVMDSIDATSFTPIDTVQPSASSTWEEFEVNLASYTGTGQFIAFKSQYNTTTNYLYIDDVYIDYIPTCPRPNTPTASNETPNSIEISWVDPNSTNTAWYIYHRVEGTTDWDSSYVTTSPAVISGLTPMTVYEFRMATDCGTEISRYTSTITHSTACDIVINIPWIENFDSYGTASGTFAPCWSRPVINTYSSTDYPSLVSLYSYSAPASIKFQSASTSEPTYAITPAFAADINSLKVTFWLKREGVSSGSMQVGVMSSSSDTSTFELVETITPTVSDWLPYEIHFDSTILSGPNNYIAFRHVTTSYIWYYWLDSVIVDYLPSSCAAPTDLVVNALNTSASITWTPSGSEVSWEVKLNSGGTPEIVGSPSKTFTNLTPNTNYTAFVRSNCGDGTSSAWISAPFTTSNVQTPPVVSTTVPNAQITQTTAVFNASFVQGSDPILTRGFDYKKATDANWTNVSVTDETNPFTYSATELTPNTQYMVRGFVSTATEGVVAGDTATFTTLAVVPPTVTTDTAVIVNNTNKTAVFNGTTAQGTDAIIARGFEYKILDNDWSTAVDLTATGSANITVTATGLTVNEYQVRAYAETAEGGKTYGNVVDFTIESSINSIDTDNL
ncbi:MAG: choice-of-anchor J domain-containing protein, partial [Desulforegulaceae bacterium]|nr:choice-of-anchor J domain-containing protein [Desulforegulaceae bacterium]